MEFSRQEHWSGLPFHSNGDIRDMGSISGSGRYPRKGNGNSLQYSCMENSMGRGALQATLHIGSQKVRHDWNMKHSPYCVWGNSGNSERLYFGVSKVTADGDCSHEIKRQLLLGRKVMTNLDSILKSRDITLLTKVCLVKAMVFPVVMYGCESWTRRKAECWRIDAFELWCWRRFLRVPWAARRSNQSILKEINSECSLYRLML